METAMATLHVETQLSSEDLLKAMEKLETSELERFVSLLLDLKARRTAPSLPSREAELLAKINQGLPEALMSRYHGLIGKRRAGTIDADEYAELLRLTDEVEVLNAQRIENLADLARLRGTSLSALMNQLGIIQTPPNA
jgi:hypothetical protein